MSPFPGRKWDIRLFTIVPTLVGRKLRVPVVPPGARVAFTAFWPNSTNSNVAADVPANVAATRPAYYYLVAKLGDRATLASDPSTSLAPNRGRG